jgi:hypothetical protein
MVMASRAEAPGARVARVQVTAWGCGVQPPVQDTSCSWGVSRIAAVIFLAVAGPALATVRVQVPSVPVVRAAGQARWTERCASAAAGVTVTV